MADVFFSLGIVVKYSAHFYTIKGIWNKLKALEERWTNSERAICMSLSKEEERLVYNKIKHGFQISAVKN